MELLWPGLPLKSAQVNLRQTIYHLRRAIPEMQGEVQDDDVEFLISDRQSVRINPKYPVESDVSRFAVIHNGSLDQRIEAMELYRGDFLEDFYLLDSSSFETWVANRRAAFRRQMLDTLAELAKTQLELGHYSAAENYARRQLEINNLREIAYRQLISILALSGRRNEALKEYKKCRRVLRQELGVEPSTETQLLLEQVRTQQLTPLVHKGMPDEGVDSPAVGEDRDTFDGEASRRISESLLSQAIETRPRHNLPQQPGRFIGRRVELAELDGFIADPEVRLITIVGPGGIGKTRLALAAAERLYQRMLAYNPEYGGETIVASSSVIIGDAKREPNFVDGVFFVSLASLSSAEHIVPMVAKAIGYQLESGARQSRTQKRQLLDFLNKKRLFLVLDNFEHLSESAELLSEIVAGAPDVQLLVTARERLHLHHEQVYPIRGLGFIRKDTGVLMEDTDVLESPASRLFIRSAQRIQPGFAVSSGDIDNLMRICSLVEGMPLALELAASWVGVLSLREISSEIRRSLDFLETTERDVPRRQRSMRALFATVWEQLAQSEQKVFARLSVFRGGFTRRAVEDTTGATISLLAKLVDKSLLHYDSQRDRYQIHELLRQYGAEKLAQNLLELNQVRDKHCTYFCDWLRQKEPMLTGTGQQTVLTEIGVDSENAQMAWYRAISNKDLDKLYRTVDSLALFYKMSGRYQEAEQATNEAAKALRTIMMDIADADFTNKPSDESPVLTTKLLSRVLSWQAIFQEGFGKHDDANRLIAESLALLDNPELTSHDLRRERAFAKRIHGWTCRDSDPQLANQLLREGLTLCRELGDQRQLAQVLHDLGNQARFRSDFDEADRLLMECLEIQTALEDSTGIARVLLDLGWIAFFQGKLIEGERLVRKGCETLAEIGGWVNISLALTAYGISQLNLGKYTNSQSLFQKSIDILEYQVYKPNLVLATSLQGWCLTHLGRYEEAYNNGQRVLTIYDESGVWSDLERAQMDLSFMALGVESYSEAESLAREASAVYRKKGNNARTAWSLSLLGFASKNLGKISESRHCALEAVQIAIDNRTILPLLLGLTLTALLLLEEDDVERALELYTLALEEPKVANSKWWHDAVGRHIDAAAATLSPEVAEAARTRGRSLDFWQIGAELLDELPARGWEQSSTMDQE
jgi:predicted ATPase/DNA-binding SARP family transcriptional activator